MNTKATGQIRVLVYRQAPNKYVGVVFEFGIVDEGKDAEGLYYKLMSAAKEFLMFVKTKDLPDHNLNKTVDDTLEDKWREALEKDAENKPNGIFAKIPLPSLQHA